MEAANRKLIRPSLIDLKEKEKEKEQSIPPRKAAAPGGNAKRAVPPEQTNAENFYYAKQMQSKTPMVVVLRDGEELHGIIEWYDRNCLKVNRDNGPNVLVYKPNIKYMYKA